MGLFSSLFSKKAPGPPPGFFPGMPPPAAMLNANRLRAGVDSNSNLPPLPQPAADGTQDLEERVAQLEADLEQASVLVETLMQLLAENGILKREAITARAKELGIEEVEELLGPEPVRPAAAAAAGPAHPVQPTFKKPFVAKRKWDEAAGPPDDTR